MVWGDLIALALEKDDAADMKDQRTAERLLEEYWSKRSQYELPWLGSNARNDVLYTYFSVRGKRDETLLEDLFEKYHFRYPMSVHNAIYYLLGKEDELKDTNIKASDWPGVYHIDQTEETIYQLDSILGKIQLYRANQWFQASPLSPVFEKPLMSCCHSRTYDFVKTNPSYKAVLSYQPNFFFGGHYHSFARRGDEVVDIAANSYYDRKENWGPILDHEIITELTIEEIEEQSSKLAKDLPPLTCSKPQKLYVLSLYHDCIHS